MERQRLSWPLHFQLQRCQAPADSYKPFGALANGSFIKQKRKY